MSALPLMGRTAFLAAALAAFIVPAAQAQANYSAKTTRAPVAAAHRPSHRGSGATAHTLVHPRLTNLSGTRRKLTPDEAGREAGMEILRERSGAPTTVQRAAHVVRRRLTRRPRLERTALRSRGRLATRVAEPGETVQGDADSDDAESGEPENAESRRLSSERSAAPAADSAEGNEGSEAAGAHGVERMPAGESGSEPSAAEEEAAEQDGSTNPAAGKTAEPASELSSNEATLVIPRGGMPAPLRGSLVSLERQNDRLEAEGLERIEDEADLAARISDKLLVPLPASSGLVVNPALEENHRYCRPWTAKFLADLARAHEAVFEKPIEVSSAVRTVEYQRKLMRTNGNAAPAEGDLVSPHLTGATVDIAKKGLSRAEMAWMRKRLMALEAEGKIDVEEEFRQACFHITVYKSYAPAGKRGPAMPAKPVVERSRRTAAEQVEAQGA